MRLAFAVAANLESEILIVDEVLAVGDAEFQKKCLGKMGEITKKEGRTVLFVSHNLEAVRNLCDRCLLLNRGKNIFEGDVKQTLEKYNSLHDNDLKNYISGRSINHRGSGTLRFTNIQVMDTKEKIRNTFMIGETVRFEVSYEVLEKMVGLNITIGLFSSKTENVLLADVAHDIKKGVVKKGLCGNVIIDIKLNSIRPGEYILYFRITDTAATKQSHPINYEIIKGIIKPLVVESKKRENVNLVGSFTLPSKVVYK
jgi:lipopolysaccharide transport system ATP-binding protein